jgi:hypothetical protein
VGDRAEFLCLIGATRQVLIFHLTPFFSTN